MVLETPEVLAEGVCEGRVDCGVKLLLGSFEVLAAVGLMEGDSDGAADVLVAGCEGSASELLELGSGEKLGEVFADGLTDGCILYVSVDFGVLLWFIQYFELLYVARGELEVGTA